jgi:hypothetical protein
MHFCGLTKLLSSGPYSAYLCQLHPHKQLPLPEISCINLKRHRSLRHRRTQHLCPEEAALCPLDDLLVDGLGRVVHNHSAGLVVNLRIDACVPNEVDDPLLALVLAQSESF